MAPKNRVPLMRSLYVRFAAAFTAVVAAVAIFQIYISTVGFWRNAAEVRQKVYWDFASEIANRIQPAVLDELNSERAEQLLFETSICSPDIEIFLIGSDGTVLTRLARSARRIVLPQVDLAPLEQALQQAPPSLPHYGQNPIDAETRSVFSVARMTIAGKPGYLYAVLGSSVFEIMRRQTGEYFLTQTAVAGLILSVVLAVLLGALLFSYLTQRFRVLAETVGGFQQDDFSVRVPSGINDEIGQLGRAVNDMADALVASRKAVVQRDQMRRDLVATISHDLRTPLAVISGNLQVVVDRLKADASPEILRLIEVAYRNAALQSVLVDDLFELSKLEAKESTPNLDAMSVDKLLSDAMENVKSQADRQGINLSIDAPAGLPEILADAKLIARALGNLLDNALRHTPPGGRINARARVLDERAAGAGDHLGESAMFVRIEIADTGAGIDPEHRQRVFAKYYQVEPGKRGAGLGLAIVKRIVDMHGGELELESESAVGSTFAFTLPVAVDL